MVDENARVGTGRKEVVEFFEGLEDFECFFLECGPVNFCFLKG